jgi:hypothetical protein
MYIDGAFPDRPGGWRPPGGHRLRATLAVAALTLAVMMSISLVTGGAVGNPSHLFIFTARTPVIPAADYHRCARGDAWVACSVPGSERVQRCVSPRARLRSYNCASSDARPATQRP